MRYVRGMQHLAIDIAILAFALVIGVGAVVVGRYSARQFDERYGKPDKD